MPGRPGEEQQQKWQYVPFGLRELVIEIFGELKKKFPTDNDFTKLFLVQKVDRKKEKKGYKIYGRSEQNSEYRIYFFAYECFGCNKYVIGPPDIKNFDETGEETVTGEKEYNVYCTNCESLLEQVELE